MPVRPTNPPARPAQQALTPNPVDMQALLRAVELGSLSAAARERDAPVSQITRAIDRLEALYRVKLLRRSTHGISVTPEGEVFLAHARQMLGAMADLANEFASRSQRATGVVRISVSPLTAEEILIPSLPALLDRHPDLRLELVSDDRMVDLPTEGIDLALRTSVVDNDHLVARELTHHQRALFATPGYLARWGEPQTPDALHRHRLITHTVAGQLNRWPFQVDRKPLMLNVSGHHRVNSTALLMQMVDQGLGIGRLNTALLGTRLRDGSLVEVLADYRDRSRFPIYLVMLPDRHRLTKIRVVIEHLTQLLKPETRVTTKP